MPTSLTNNVNTASVNRPGGFVHNTSAAIAEAQKIVSRTLGVYEAVGGPDHGKQISAAPSYSGSNLLFGKEILSKDPAGKLKKDSFVGFLCVRKPSDFIISDAVMAIVKRFAESSSVYNQSAARVVEMFEGKTIKIMGRQKKQTALFSSCPGRGRLNNCLPHWVINANLLAESTSFYSYQDLQLISALQAISASKVEEENIERLVQAAFVSPERCCPGEGIPNGEEKSEVNFTFDLNDTEKSEIKKFVDFIESLSTVSEQYARSNMSIYFTPAEKLGVNRGFVYDKELFLARKQLISCLNEMVMTYYALPKAERTAEEFEKFKKAFLSCLQEEEGDVTQKSVADSSSDMSFIAEGESVDDALGDSSKSIDMDSDGGDQVMEEGGDDADLAGSGAKQAEGCNNASNRYTECKERYEKVQSGDALKTLKSYYGIRYVIDWIVTQIAVLCGAEKPHTIAAGFFKAVECDTEVRGVLDGVEMDVRKLTFAAASA